MSPKLHSWSDDDDDAVAEMENTVTLYRSFGCRISLRRMDETRMLFYNMQRYFDTFRQSRGDPLAGKAVESGEVVATWCVGCAKHRFRGRLPSRTRARLPL